VWDDLWMKIAAGCTAEPHHYHNRIKHKCI
jgi:hypothetical protein